MRGSVLDEAKKVINGARQDAYGNPEDSFGEIAVLWNWYLVHREGKVLTGRDVGMMMALLKVAREVNGHKGDNVVDACGYLALYEDMVEREAKVFAEAGSENLPRYVSEDLPGVRTGSVGRERVGWEDVGEKSIEELARAFESGRSR